MTTASTSDRSAGIVRTAFARFDVRALAAANAILFALLLFVATAALLLQTPAAGQEVGPHLALLAHFLPGYTVSWSGSFIGAAYGLIGGTLIGAFMGASWNLAHFVYLMLALVRRGAGAGAEL
jgi:hypothetical protein